ncbi:hypothetical protein HS1genome_2201 [Sulfodiicoccus acidiphilus]|uniref:Uncharacterized protein n=1 Tax=Sulfodiicoccus acidiphilus TaxID=1670455 RepID=A0A348B6L0_9CREN|nr:hypothetical protein [Sulfodiicoccus acidiphilus]BBD73812.1 hypothetical protein HS1genome_2201 [Sulfodiicoccus acidiphilus]GGT96561.1 hypothetical protein GCM10007116_12720 [Sulfodiicoccus acidiphilus]
MFVDPNSLTLAGRSEMMPTPANANSASPMAVDRKKEDRAATEQARNRTALPIVGKIK